MSRCSLLIALTVAIACAPQKRTAEPVAPLTGPEQIAPQLALGALAHGEPSTAIPVEADDARLGAAQAPVTIVAFLDFQCTFCAQGFGTLEALQRQYGTKRLRIVFKHLPLDFHELALPAAIAGQAVMQGAGSEAFFRFARSTFDHQSQLSFAKLGEWAEAAGLSRDDYNRLVQDGETVQRIAQDVRLSRKLGIDGTPAFYVNGRLVPGAQPLEYFAQVIDEEASAMKSKETWEKIYQARVAENLGNSVLEALLSADPHSYRAPVGRSPVRGSADAPVTIVMFTDFKCPYCKRAETTLKLLRNKYGPKLRFVYKHMPLPFHRAARPAALVGEAIFQKKGDTAFWSYSDELFEHSPDLSLAMLRELGARHGLDQDELENALDDDDPKLAERLEEDRDLAEDIEAHGTPHFFINGKRLSGARPVEQFEALIDHGLREAKKLRVREVSPEDIYAELQRDALSPGNPEKMSHEVSEEGRPSRGPRDAPIVIHTFSDFECPYCRKGERLLDELDELYPGKLRVVWHDFPLDFHDRARPAAQAAQEAYRQLGDEGFWKMHRLLFGLDSDKTALSPADIKAHGNQLDLDQGKLMNAIENNAHNSTIGRDVGLGKSLGIRGTPAYVVAGYLVTGAKPRRHFERLIERELKALKSNADKE